MKILEQLLIIFIFSIIGDLISSVLPFPIPGSIIGLILLFVSLNLKLLKLEDISGSGEWLKNNMAILFVPLSVGIMNYFDLLIDNAIALTLITVLSTLVTYFVSAKVSEYILKKEVQ
ncbi:CidA/LrgA family protein [Erysipelothrix urinaevulpis]|uniref:CidA/LrgA family protein n=1 Tax=Erysipelothrix urinaevulpis TaxID=2683717 RepID=UPI00135AA1CF|nr:CidA/LrgA family protein [Erysipelothrix urinaevulpis]